jgi:8-oxo-dGTP diphosphatase
MPEFCYSHARPAVTVDLVAFTVRDGGLSVLLVRRKHAPYAGSWALPGGFLGMDEPVEDAARREFQEETGLTIPGHVSPLGFFGTPGRDPRGRTISLAFVALLRGPGPHPEGGDDAAEAQWHQVADLEPLAFDHDLILATALTWLELGIKTHKLGPELLPHSFDDDDVRALFRALFGTARRAVSWRGGLEREGRIVTVPGSSHRYCAAGGAEPGG